MNSPSIGSVGFILRIFFCYLAMILIALQSISAIAVTKDSHQQTYQHTHIKTTQDVISHNHHDIEHHDEDSDHPDCHANHCHHSNLIYLELSSKVYLDNALTVQLVNRNSHFISLPISPDLRPPIV